MTTTVKLGLFCTGVALLAYCRVAYVRHFYVHSPEQALGAALEPINFASFVLLWLCGFTSVIFFACAIIGCFTGDKKEAESGPRDRL